jgi:mannose-6-phosphate isomerase-like protein (cupin superfamily)
MRNHVLALAIATLTVCFSPLSAQQQNKGGDPGINPTTILDRAEVRIGRVEIAPGATRSMHAHNDVQFHLFIPLAGTLLLTIGSDKPVEAQPGQAYFIKAGTQHGFTNTGSLPARVIEVFVKPNATAAAIDPDAFAALALSFSATPNSN